MRRIDAVLGIAALALIVALSVLRASSQTPPSYPSTRDTGMQGYAALYDVLSRERVAVGRYEDPLGTLPARDSTLVLAGDGALATATASRDGMRVLDRWVRSGGVLVVADASAVSKELALPAARTLRSKSPAVAVTGCGYRGARALRVAGSFDRLFARTCSATRKSLLLAADGAPAVAYRRGRGTVVAIAGSGIFDNAHLAQRDNAAFAYAVFASGRPVLFDERIHGYAAGRTFSQVLRAPVRIAIGIAILSLLLAIAGANIPFAPPVEASPPDERDTSAYITSLARMLERGGAAQDTIERLARYSEAVIGANASGDAHARELSMELAQVQIASAPSTGRLLRAGRIFARVRKDYE